MHLFEKIKKQSFRQTAVWHFKNFLYTAQGFGKKSINKFIK